jgi:hypothetical protein
MVLFSYKKGPTADVCETIMGMTDTEDTMFLTREGMEVKFNGKLPNMTSRSPETHINIIWRFKDCDLLYYLLQPSDNISGDKHRN